jgi:predicted nucleic acid-binding protein
MLCLVDTNVLLRSLDRTHPHSRLVRRAVIVLRRQDNRLCLLPQNLIEFWAVATRPVDVNGLGMSTDWAAAQLIRMKHFFIVLPDVAEILTEWERLVIQHQVTGKKTHDARLVAAMNVHGVLHILTFNGVDFSRYSGITVIDPRSLEPTSPISNVGPTNH